MSKKLGEHEGNCEFTQARILSQYFTSDQISEQTFQWTMEFMHEHNMNPDDFTFLEPSAGKGTFFYKMPKDRRVGVEVDPELCRKNPEYIFTDLNKGGFLSQTKESLGLSNVENRNIIVIGNPPFSDPRTKGRSSIISLAFVNHCAEMADTIAFILGTTFRRPRTQAKIHPNFHLVFDRELPDVAFVRDNKPTKVNTVFQIWKRQPEKREIDLSINWVKKGSWGGPWHFVKSTDRSANIRVCHWGSNRTVGRTDGPEKTAQIVECNILKKAKNTRKGYNPDNSHFYICAEDPEEVFENFQRKKHLFFNISRDRTLGQNPDLTLTDFVRIYKATDNTEYVRGKFVKFN